MPLYVNFRLPSALLYIRLLCLFLGFSSHLADVWNVLYLGRVAFCNLRHKYKFYEDSEPGRCGIDRVSVSVGPICEPRVDSLSGEC